jgi:hypothetical protein
MEGLVKVIQVIAPLVTVGLAVFGLLVWYWQLVAKRKFEIAEQAITVWRRANDGLSYVRGRFIRGGEGDSITISATMMGKTKENAERYRYVYERLNNVNKAFEEVRVTQILVDLHISSKAAQSFDALFRVRHLVRVDAEMLIEDFDEYFPTPQHEHDQNQRRIKYRHGITENRRQDGKPEETDQYSRVLDEAKEVLESECRQILRPKTPTELLFGRTVRLRPHEWTAEAKKVLGIRS